MLVWRWYFGRSRCANDSNWIADLSFSNFANRWALEREGCELERALVDCVRGRKHGKSTEEPMPLNSPEQPIYQQKRSVLVVNDDSEIVSSLAIQLASDFDLITAN